MTDQVKLTSHQDKPQESSTSKKIPPFSEKEIDELKAHKILDTNRCITKWIYEKNYDEKIEKSFYEFWFSYLQSTNWEKKIFVWNSIGEIIYNISHNRANLRSHLPQDCKDIPYSDKEWLNNFIKNKQIIKILLGENVHDELLKRSIQLFRYAALNKYENQPLLEEESYTLWWDNYINKHESIGVQIENIIYEISSVLPEDKKLVLYKKIKEIIKDIIEIKPNGIGVNNSTIINKKIFFVYNFTESCFKYTNVIYNSQDITKGDYWYGLPLLFEYTSDWINDEKKQSNNWSTVQICIQYITSLLSNINWDENIILKVLELCIVRIMNQRDIIQSYLLIRSIFINCFDDRIHSRKQVNSLNNLSKSKEKILEDLDTKYDILTWIVQDIERYWTDWNKKYDTIDTNNVYEGWFKHSDNIRNRFQWLFFFQTNETLGYVLDFLGNKHLLPWYTILNENKFYAERNMFYQILLRHLDDWSEETLDFLFNNILNNSTVFKYDSINPKALDLFIGVFKYINTDKNENINENTNSPRKQRLYSLHNDGKNLRVVYPEISGIDTLWKILLYNPSIIVQDSICDIWSNWCVNLYDYREWFTKSYWEQFINNWSNYLSKAYNENNLKGWNGLIKLWKMIYLGVAFPGKIPQKRDIYTVGERGLENEIFKFVYWKTSKEYKVRVGWEEKLFYVRWRIAYYYDIHVNELYFTNKSKTIKANWLNDFDIFYKIFDSSEITYVGSEKDVWLKWKDNPKEWIDTNKEIKSIWLLLMESADYNSFYINEVWKMVNWIPKMYILDLNNDIKSLGEKGEVGNEEWMRMKFTKKSIYSITYTIDIIMWYIEKQNEVDYLSNFVSVNKGDLYWINTFLGLSEEYFTAEITIGYECLNSLSNLLLKIIANKLAIFSDKKIIKEQLGKKIISLIKRIMNLSSLKAKENEAMLSNIETYSYKLVKYCIKHDDASCTSSMGEALSSHSCDSFRNFMNENHFFLYTESIKNLLKLYSYIYTEQSFVHYLLLNTDDFISIYIEAFIENLNPDIKSTWYHYLNMEMKENEESMVNYFNLIFKPDLFFYINNAESTQKNGLYFHVIANIIKTHKIDIDNNDALYKQFLKISTDLIQYIQGFNENLNDMLLEGYLSLFKNILVASEKIISYVIENYDIYDIFWVKCILSKCQNNTLLAPKAKCKSYETLSKMFTIVTIFCNHNPGLKNKIISILNDYHYLGFWKNKYNINWNINLYHDNKGKFVGWKNLGCTCYMNSILQQIFMIPALREEILRFEPKYNDKYKTTYYQIKNIFASLKAYESQYYNPKDFCVNFDKSLEILGEQMDADEFYSLLIDVLESYIKDDEDIKNLFKHFLGGINIDELIFKECPHKRENEFFFNSIQLQVSGKHNWEESLQSYVKGEMMEGDNAIYCEECKTKSPALKRQSFKILPRHWVVVWKRFEFNYDTLQKYKLNDYFEFPHQLDMTPYTQIYLTDNKNGSPAQKSNMYYLKGVVIHIGTSESGHYYSIIKDNNSNKWYEFNDTNVKWFDINDLQHEAFGGTEENYKKETVDKTTSAYILIYAKCDISDVNNFPIKLSNTEITNYSNIPLDIFDRINSDMFHYWVIKNISSLQYQFFILDWIQSDLRGKLKYCFRNENFDLYSYINRFTKLPIREFDVIRKDINNISCVHDTPLTGPCIESSNTLFPFICTYYFNIIIRCKDKSKLDEYTDIIKLYVNSNLENAVWLIEEFSNKDVLQEFLIDCPNTNIKKIVVGIIYCSLIQINKNGKSDLIVSYMNNILLVIQGKINLIDIENIFYILYRICILPQPDTNHCNSPGNSPCTPYIDYLIKMNMIDYIKDYYVNNRESKLKLDIHENSLLNSSHHHLNEKRSSKTDKLTSSEDSYETKRNEKWKTCRNDKFLIGVWIVLLKKEDLDCFDECTSSSDSNNIYEIVLFNLQSKWNMILFSDKWYTLYDKFLTVSNNKEWNKNILDEKILPILIKFINNSDYCDIYFPLWIIQRLCFYYGNYNKLRFELVIKYMHLWVGNNSMYYYYIERITKFIIDMYMHYYHEIVADHNNNFSNLILMLGRFFKENKVPPKFIPSQTIKLIKGNYTFPKSVSKWTVKQFEETMTANARDYEEKLNAIYMKNCLTESGVINNQLEDYTDFKFMKGDILQYDGYRCRVKACWDEIIEIEYDKKECAKRNLNDEWVETGNSGISMLNYYVN